MNTKKFDHDAILKDYLAGLSVKEIAAKYGCAGNLGCKLARDRGVSRSPRVVEIARSKLGKIVKESYAKSSLRSQRLRMQKRMGEYATRHGIPAAVAKYGYSRSAIRTYAKLHGWEPAPLLYDQDAILKDYLAGMPLAKIVEKYGCEESYASKLAKRMGKVRNPELSNINKRKPHSTYKKKPQ